MFFRVMWPLVRERTPPKNPEHVNETREHLAACSVEYCKPSAATLLAKLS